MDQKTYIRQASGTGFLSRYGQVDMRTMGCVMCVWILLISEAYGQKSKQSRVQLVASVRAVISLEPASIVRTKATSVTANLLATNELELRIQTAPGETPVPVGLPVGVETNSKSYLISAKRMDAEENKVLLRVSSTDGQLKGRERAVEKKQVCGTQHEVGQRLSDADAVNNGRRIRRRNYPRRSGRACALRRQCSYGEVWALR
jgi:hypothetical protein